MPQADKFQKCDWLRPVVFREPMKQIFFFILFERAFKMIKNGIYFIVIALLVAELFNLCKLP